MEQQNLGNIFRHYSLGLRHVFSGSAQNTMDTLVEILDDLDVVRKEIAKSEVSGKIIALESLLLYSHNKTSAWLQLKSPDERERLLQAARSMTSS